MTPKMLVLDLDGTTLTHEGVVTDADAAAAERLRDHGVHVTIATGRLFGGTLDAARRLGVTGSVAVMNGTELVDVDSGRTIYGRYVHGDHRPALRSMLRDFGLAPILFGSERVHHCQQSTHLNTYLRTWTPQVHHHEDLPHEAWVLDRLVAIGGTGEMSSVRAAADRVSAQFPDLEPVSFNTWDGHAFLKLRPLGDDKGTALDQLAAERGLSADQAVAVGDWINDLPMLQRAGRSFAMHGSAQPALDAASETLASVRGEGGAVVELAQRIWGV